jgi:hypothetical protein
MQTSGRRKIVTDEPPSLALEKSGRQLLSRCLIENTFNLHGQCGFHIKLGDSSNEAFLRWRRFFLPVSIKLLCTSAICHVSASLMRAICGDLSKALRMLRARCNIVSKGLNVCKIMIWPSKYRRKSPRQGLALGKGGRYVSPSAVVDAKETLHSSFPSVP